MPSSNGNNGRRADGKFARGNPGGPGNPQAARVLRYRERLMTMVSEKDFDEVIAVVLKEAKAGNLHAVALLFDRILGKVKELVIEGDTHNHYPILVTTTAEAIKQLEANRGLGDDPLRGIKRLPKGDGK